MRDFCVEVCGICRAYLENILPGGVRGKICVQNADCEAAFALCENEAPQLPPVGHAWFESPALCGNRICFFLSEAFYREAAAHIVKEPLPAPDGTVQSETDYARARMRMLARKRGDAFPPAARRALWRALSAHTADVSAALRQKRLRDAAALSLSLGRDIPLRERQGYMQGCGTAAACLTRLLNETI